MSNYRPVSLLTSFSKIYEKVMQTRLLKRLTKYIILTIEQFGFRRKLTTENALYNLTNKILNVLNSKLIVGGILCLRFIFFNSVNNNILFSKLECCGIIGTENALHKSHLHGKYQSASIYKEKINNSSLSIWAKVKHSVPQ
jgi:hypothetical protein